MSQITVFLPDGSPTTVPAGSTAGAVAAAISPRLARAALAAVVDARMVDLSAPVPDGSAFRVITPDSPEALELVRHSTAHLMAAAVTQLFPGAQCGVGPAIEDGFYYDFVVERPFVPADLEAIEARMREIAAAGE
jgi:threonyl-tRNA synthetase